MISILWSCISHLTVGAVPSDLPNALPPLAEGLEKDGWAVGVFLDTLPSAFRPSAGLCWLGCSRWDLDTSADRLP